MSGNIVLGISILVVYVVGYFCSYCVWRYWGEDDADAFGASLMWPVTLVAFPLCCLIEKFSNVGRYFFQLGEKNRKEKK